MNLPFKKSPIVVNQALLSPRNIFDLLPEGHECYVYRDLFDQLDTSTIESLYSDKGQHAYHPKLIVSILIYSYSRGVFSSREIERRCQEDISFMYIAQMGCPNFRVLSDFRKDHTEFFHSCFKQTVKLAMELKLASLGHISLDGSKFKASSSKHKAMSYKRLKEKEQQLTDEIEALVAQAKRCDKEEDQAYQDKTGYEVPEDLKYKQERLDKIKMAKEALEQREALVNPGKEIDDKKQISVDADMQIIVGQHISLNANDKQEILPALEALQATTGRLPEKMTGDNGYLIPMNNIHNCQKLLKPCCKHTLHYHHSTLPVIATLRQAEKLIQGILLTGNGFLTRWCKHYVGIMAVTPSIRQYYHFLLPP
ncbi:transposase (fragment) [Crenothrix polyspora]|uniref:Transposase n=1 Tax=Crenothrix polyspora TaxID=360316 RepID=A0A1R4HF84_9GAMM